MEDFGRREFVKGVLCSLPVALFPNVKAFAHSKGVRIELPQLPIQNTYIAGERKGKRILIVGGIHGNEPGAYKAAEIMRHVKVKKGELFIAPRMNFLSILANRRGYNGDMNRKFARISKKDPDYPRVKWLKDFIKEVKPDLLLTLHDGFGFHAINPKAWGQCIVIDEERYRGIELGKIARIVSNRLNGKIHKKRWKIPVFNTKTFHSNTKHPEQRKSLTYYCLKECSVPAICLETSKQMPNLETKVRFHLMMLREFFKIYGVEIEPDFDYLISNVSRFLNSGKIFSVDLILNGRRVTLTSSKVVELPPGSYVKFVSFHGTDGTNAVFNGVNLNIRNIVIKRKLSVDVKNDFEKKFSVRFIVKRS
jgi:hypothetical protein